VRIGVLTGGGDCPGLNAVIRALVQRAIKTYGWDVLGIRHGWQGLLRDEVEPLDLRAVSGILPRGGTILGTSRTNPYKQEAGEEAIRSTLERRSIDAIAAIGGEDTLGVALKLHLAGIPLVGVPKTIDNDVNGTDYTFGYNTALSIATDAIDRLHTTAESHDRVMVVEVMGRHAGWIALEAGMAGGADMILIPEFPMSFEEICEAIKRRHDRGKNFSIIVVAEGAQLGDDRGGSVVIQSERTDAFGHVRLGGIAPALAEAIEDRTGYETRYSVLGHIQRGGSPTAFDRVLGTRFGLAVVDLLHAKKYGRMVALQGTQIRDVSLEEAVGTLKTVTPERYNMVRVFFS
jgi:ATP-dependent phosphofructokinase / diphosphate-dependent phosphofructokinase